MVTYHILGRIILHEIFPNSYGTTVSVDLEILWRRRITNDFIPELTLYKKKHINNYLLRHNNYGRQFYSISKSMPHVLQYLHKFYTAFIYLLVSIFALDLEHL